MGHEAEDNIQHMVDKPSARLTKIKSEKTQINNIRDKKDITAGTNEIQKVGPRTDDHMLTIYMVLSWKI